MGWLVVAAALAAGPMERETKAPDALVEAIETGQADPARVGAIVGWILREREEDVAAGLADVLTRVTVKGGGPDGERWNATAQAVVAFFQAALRDGMDNRRGRKEPWAELAKVVAAARPAVSDALAEADPAAKARAKAALEAALPSAREVRDPALREALAEALRLLDAPAARVAPPDAKTP